MHSAPDWQTRDEDQPATGSALRREFAVFFRYRKVMILCVGLSLLAAAAYNYGARPLYESVAVLSLEEAGVSPLKARGSVDLARRAGALEYQVRLLGSPELALLAVTNSDPVLLAELSRGKLGGLAQRLVAETRLRLGIPRVIGASIPEMVSAFRSRLAIRYEPPSNWVHVTFTGYDPKASLLAVERLLSIYMTEAEREAQGEAGTNRQELEDRMAEGKGQVVEALGKLKEFERKEGVEGLEERRGLLQKEIDRLQDTLIATRQNLTALRALADESARASVASMQAIPAVRDDPEVRAATSRLRDIRASLAAQSTTLGDRHPDVISLRSQLANAGQGLEARIELLRESTARDYRLAVRQEADVARLLASTRDQLARLSESAVERSFIQKQAEAGQGAVSDLIARSVRKTDDQVFFAPQVLQRPTLATVPTSPQRGRNFQLALGFGILAGVLLTWLYAHLDETLKTPEDVKAAFSSPLLGMVPAVRGSTFDLLRPGVGEQSRLFEAHRVLRTNLSARVQDNGLGHLLLVTSSRAGEGKTTTAAGLAVAMARAGLKVLLVDGDLRRASLSRLFSANGRLGLSNAVGGASLNSCIRKTHVCGLSLPSAGTARADPPELLSRPNLAKVLKGVRADYDWIVCDAPPVLAVSDAAILARLSDQVLVVIGANATPSPSVRATLDQLASVGASVGGLILNRVDLDRDSHYFRYYYAGQYEDYSGRSPRKGHSKQQAHLS